MVEQRIENPCVGGSIPPPTTTFPYFPYFMHNFDAIIVGAGAAGLMCAIEAGKRGRKTLIIDRARSVGKKIRISGGGRCNFTNINASPKNFISKNPHFCISALKRYTAHDFIKLVEKHKIKYHEKTLGQLFCDDSSRQIIDMLVSECDWTGNVRISLNDSVTDIIKTENGFDIKTLNSGDITCESLVIATGGPSIPKMGATGWGYNVAKQFGINVIEPKAALVPFTLSEQHLADTKELSGVSANIIASCNDIEFKEAMLFTHRGLSGPSILQISSYWNEGDEIELNLAPDIDLTEELKKKRTENPKQEIHNILSSFIPRRIAEYICREFNYTGKIADFSNIKIDEMVKRLKNWKIKPDGTEGFRTAEVTKGGIDTDELSSKTFEANKVNGLYFIGEVVDVTGWLGGYNFQWAWSSGHAAGQFI